MVEEKVKLYGVWGSPFSKRVEIALKMKGIEYEYSEVDIYNKSPDFLRYNPVHKKVPVLVHGTKPIAESQVIIEYIDETWDSGVSIMPRDPHHRALARFWARFIDDKIFLSIYRISWLGEDKEIKEVLENLRILDKELAGKRFFGGESVGFIDIAAIFVGHWLGVVEEAAGMDVLVTKEAFPSLCKWQKELVASDIIRETLPPRDKLVVFLRGRIEATRGTLASK